MEEEAGDDDELAGEDADDQVRKRPAASSAGGGVKQLRPLQLWLSSRASHQSIADCHAEWRAMSAADKTKYSQDAKTAHGF